MVPSSQPSTAPSCCSSVSVLDVLALECNEENDYMFMAGNGNQYPCSLLQNYGTPPPCSTNPLAGDAADVCTLNCAGHCALI